MILFKTVHGSHLYGTSGPESDMDIYQVHSDLRRSKQTIQDGQDVVKVSFDEFLRLCDKGVPQALEAMYSPKAAVDHMKWFRSAYRPGVQNALHTYRSTIRAFLKLDPTPKRLSHAVRLGYAMGDLYRRGRIFPELTGRRLRVVLAYKQELRVTELEIIHAMDLVNKSSEVEVFTIEQDLPVILERLHHGVEQKGKEPS